MLRGSTRFLVRRRSAGHQLGEVRGSDDQSPVPPFGTEAPRGSAQRRQPHPAGLQRWVRVGCGATGRPVLGPREPRGRGGAGLAGLRRDSLSGAGRRIWEEGGLRGSAGCGRRGRAGRCPHPLPPLGGTGSSRGGGRLPTAQTASGPTERAPGRQATGWAGLSLAELSGRGSLLQPLGGRRAGGAGDVPAPPRPCRGQGLTPAPRQAPATPSSSSPWSRGTTSPRWRPGAPSARGTSCTRSSMRPLTCT